jgi:hypothetical protein
MFQAMLQQLAQTQGGSASTVHWVSVREVSLQPDVDMHAASHVFVATP